MADLWQEIRGAVQDGYRLAADVLGAPCRHFRPLPGVAALDATCMLGILPASFDANDYRYSRAMPSGKAVWTGLWDASQTVVGDYLVDDSTATTWFIASQDPLLPMQVVRCDAVVTLTAAAEPNGPAPSDHGYQEGYGGDNASDESSVLPAFPCSILKGSARGEVSATALPSGGRNDPGLEVMLPVLPGDAEVELGSILHEANGSRYVITAVESTAKGWRLNAVQTTSI